MERRTGARRGERRAKRGDGRGSVASARDASLHLLGRRQMLLNCASDHGLTSKILSPDPLVGDQLTILSLDSANRH
jgi:hypothetical protein